MTSTFKGLKEKTNNLLIFVTINLANSLINFVARIRKNIKEKMIQKNQEEKQRTCR